MRGIPATQTDFGTATVVSSTRPAPNGKGIALPVPVLASLSDTPTRSKYRNRKVEVEGFTFDSKKEANRWLDLREEQRAGRITELRRQVGFPIVVNGEPICEYVADLVYLRAGVRVVEDCKSKVTRKIPVYVVKKKLMRACYGIEIVEV